MKRLLLLGFAGAAFAQDWAALRTDADCALLFHGDRARPETFARTDRRSPGDALDQMERVRRRNLLITRIALYPSVLFLAMSVVLMLFHTNKWLGLTYGIVSLFGMIGAGVLDIQRSANANTQRILRAIEASSRGEPRT